MSTVQELKSYLNDREGYKFTTDNLTFSSVELKGEKQSYVTGYISTPDIDVYNELVTMK